MKKKKKNPTYLHCTCSVVLCYIVAVTYAWDFVFTQQVKQNLRLPILCTYIVWLMNKHTHPSSSVMTEALTIVG